MVEPQRPNDNPLCMPRNTDRQTDGQTDRQTHTHTHKIFGTYCFSTTAMVMRTRLNITFRYKACLVILFRFLSVKKWLLRKKHQIELARKRGWKGYWVCLKGTTLLFYPCDSREGRSVEAAPKHLIIVDGAIMQPIPEHPKRDYIFCLSTAFGDAYLFQVGAEPGLLKP